MGEDLHRRQYVRVEVTLPVEFTLDDESISHYGSVFDLGAGGMRLVASYDLPPRAVIGLKFRLPGGQKTITSRGLVVLSFFQRHEQKFHHGVAFTQIDPHDKIAIGDFVDSQDLRRRA